MLRILILILVLMSSFVFAQTEEKPQAVKFDEFETATNGFVKMRMDSFYNELSNNPASQGYIINFGTDKEIAIREKQITVSINWRKFDASRITIVSGGFWKSPKSELWTVPPGAENPQPTSTAVKIDEFGKTPDGDFKARLDGFYTALGNKPNSQGFILNYGSAKEILALERRISKFIAFRRFVLSKVTFKKAGAGKQGIKTEFWIITTDDESRKPQTK